MQIQKFYTQIRNELHLLYNLFLTNYLNFINIMLFILVFCQYIHFKEWQIDNCCNGIDTSKICWQSGDQWESFVTLSYNFLNNTFLCYIWFH